jgi:uncharacterized protein
MDITPLIPQNTPLIQRYGQGFFHILGQNYNNQILFVDQSTVHPLSEFPTDLKQWDTQEHWLHILKLCEGLDILLMGCGATSFLIPSIARKMFTDQQINIDPMDSGAACRTFNILRTEGRRAGCVLIPV